MDARIIVLREFKYGWYLLKIICQHVLMIINVIQFCAIGFLCIFSAIVDKFPGINPTEMPNLGSAEGGFVTSVKFQDQKNVTYEKFRTPEKVCLHITIALPILPW